MNNAAMIATTVTVPSTRAALAAVRPIDAARIINGIITHAGDADAATREEFVARRLFSLAVDSCACDARLERLSLLDYFLLLELSLDSPMIPASLINWRRIQ